MSSEGIAPGSTPTTLSRSSRPLADLAKTQTGSPKPALVERLRHHERHVAQHRADRRGLVALQLQDLHVARAEQDVERVRLGVGAGLTAVEHAGVGRGRLEVLGRHAQEFDKGLLKFEVDLVQAGALGQRSGVGGVGGQLDAPAAGIQLPAAVGELHPEQRDRRLLGEEAPERALAVEQRLDPVDALQGRLPAAQRVGMIVDVGRSRSRRAASRRGDAAP